mmetsp:Transcript_3713/g.10016  ORF Transcript_3713/g.10016 Transcript_3713/m.10016 type:complete len:364 (-) Transcript_3713:152-1243(-)
MRRDVVSAPALDCFLLFTFTLAREQKERAACVYDRYVQWDDIPSLRACNRSVVIWTCVHRGDSGFGFLATNRCWSRRRRVDRYLRVDRQAAGHVIFACVSRYGSASPWSSCAFTCAVVIAVVSEHPAASIGDGDRLIFRACSSICLAASALACSILALTPSSSSIAGPSGIISSAYRPIAANSRVSCAFSSRALRSSVVIARTLSSAWHRSAQSARVASLRSASLACLRWRERRADSRLEIMRRSRLPSESSPSSSSSGMGPRSCSSRSSAFSLTGTNVGAGLLETFVSVAFGEAWGFVAFGGAAGLASFEGACLFLGDRGSTSTALQVGLEPTFERVARLSATMAKEEDFTPKSRNGGGTGV